MVLLNFWLYVKISVGNYISRILGSRFWDLGNFEFCDTRLDWPRPHLCYKQMKR